MDGRTHGNRAGRRVLPWGGVMIALAFTPSVCRADAPQNEQRGDDRQNVALNHGVAIDGPPSTVAVEKAAKLATADSLHPRRFQRLVRHGGPAGRREGAGDPQKDRPTPWYRSGPGALAVVLVLIGTAAWALRRWMPARRRGDSRLLQVVGRTSLSPKHSVALIQLGRRFVMVGISGDKMSRLCEVFEPDEVAELAAQRADTTGQGTGGFERLLLEEAAEYRGTSEKDAAETSSIPLGQTRASDPLKNLLRRMKTLRLMK